MYEQRLSIRATARLTGVKKSTIQKLLQENANPTMRTMERMAAGLHVRIEELYESEYK